MTDIEFKEKVVKALIKLTDMLISLQNESKTSNLFADDPDEGVVSGAFKLNSVDYQIYTGEGPVLSDAIDLDEIFNPTVVSVFRLSGDNTSINYSIVNENPISATIVDDHYVQWPTAITDLSSCQLDIRISTEIFGEPAFSDVKLNLLLFPAEDEE